MREGVKLSVIRPDRSRGRQQARAESRGAVGRAGELQAESRGAVGRAVRHRRVKGQPDPLFSGRPDPSTCSVYLWCSMERS